MSAKEIKSLKNYISTTKNEIFTTFKIETISNLIIYYEDLQQKVEQLENENFNIRENIHLERISLPPELTKDKDFMELYDIPSYKDLQQKVEQLEKENIKQKEIIENLTTMTVCGDKKQIKNTAQYKLEELENIRKEAVEYINHATIGADSSPIEDSWLYDLYETRHILNKGGISKYE